MPPRLQASNWDKLEKISTTFQKTAVNRPCTAPPETFTEKIIRVWNKTEKMSMCTMWLDVGAYLLLILSIAKLLNTFINIELVSKYMLWNF